MKREDEKGVDPAWKWIAITLMIFNLPNFTFNLGRLAGWVMIQIGL